MNLVSTVSVSIHEMLKWCDENNIDYSYDGKELVIFRSDDPHPREEGTIWRHYGKDYIRKMGKWELV